MKPRPAHAIDMVAGAQRAVFSALERFGCELLIKDGAIVLKNSDPDIRGITVIGMLVESPFGALEHRQFGLDEIAKVFDAPEWRPRQS